MTPYKPKNILITGAAGFIASHVANRLIRSYPEYNIIVLDKLDYCSNLKNLLPSHGSPNFKFVKGDIGSADLVNFPSLIITESIDTIMRFAAQTHADNSFGNSLSSLRTISMALMSSLRHARSQARSEASQLLPTNPYSATKAGAEMLVMAYGRSYGLPVITTRGNNVYGPNQFPEKLIPKFILLAMRGQTLPIHGDGSNVRSYLYCEDVAEAFEVILHKGEVGHVYNIGTKKERSVLDVARDICKLFSLDPEAAIKFVENRPFNDQRYFLDDQKLENLGWTPRTQWEEGLRKTIEWYTSNPDWWGDVTGALLPHPRMLMMAGIEGHLHGSEEIKAMICKKQGISYEYGKGRLEERSQLVLDIQNVKPTHVFNAAGVTGRPNVDWCESHKPETIRTNVVGTLTLADVCKQHGLLMVNYATGCIFEYDTDHPEGSESIMPISSDLSNPMRNFITKISRYNKVVNIPNSMTVLDELLPISVEMAKRNCRGIWNFTNPGVVSHNEILEMYKSYIDPGFEWVNFTLEEQAKVIVAPRSNNEMDGSKLKAEFPELLSIKDSLIKYVFEPNKKTTGGEAN
ncbi:hypothetical protein J5N97_012877 [Dioscorea zingiberensis]|uniref:NAD-dependent epimerase/dehydratase domain-containing protein n=1 Tax=Dioscorea zingiberensis TaxID=325984 RepID=A0A9D5HI94_9LILI|nr:hypothetical protein J5N97_012877 [Dioscorea zingiberensis]